MSYWKPRVLRPWRVLITKRFDAGKDFRACFDASCISKKNYRFVIFFWGLAFFLFDLLSCVARNLRKYLDSVWWWIFYGNSEEACLFFQTHFWKRIECLMRNDALTIHIVAKASTKKTKIDNDCRWSIYRYFVGLFSLLHIVKLLTRMNKLFRKWRFLVTLKGANSLFISFSKPISFQWVTWNLWTHFWKTIRMDKKNFDNWKTIKLVIFWKKKKYIFIH